MTMEYVQFCEDSRTLSPQRAPRLSFYNPIYMMSSFARRTMGCFIS